ncbi:MAG: mechanosensitive ion channel, partial [Acidimicrobiia bacterium]|nr:mechanosensitive ion channel [Acidimicrobiia bacterium]
MEDFFSGFGLSADVVNKTVSSLIAIVILLVLRRVVVRAIQSRVEDPESLYRTRKSVTYVTTIVVILTLAWIWVDALDSVTTYIGLVSAGIAIALADVLKNLAGWAFIILRRPFRVGDRVQVGETIGDVVDVRIFRFSLLEVGNWVDADQSTGRLIHVPNGVLFTERLANYTEGFEFIWHEIPVLVTFESDWRRARERMDEVLASRIPKVAGDAEHRIRATARQYQIRIGTLT